MKNLLVLMLFLSLSQCSPQFSSNYGGFTGGGHGGFSKPYGKPSPPTYGPLKPKSICNVEDEKLNAEICTPAVSTDCEEESQVIQSASVEEECFDIVSTECSSSSASQSIESCSFDVSERIEKVPIKSVEVSYVKRCNIQTQSVCTKPAPSGYGAPPSYHQKPTCKEVDRETCYNSPKVVPKDEEIEITVPEIVKNCQQVEIDIPTVTCNEKRSQECYQIPKVVDMEITYKKCSVKIGEPNCEAIELVLPKQTCKDIIETTSSNTGYSPPPPAPKITGYASPPSSSYHQN